ncbi:hypothetical protein GJ496_004804 [Pomphorhynchus laevis]|nr:hypothetical protein GJ496_004804 [Pomphorhynchus laevis]
MEELRHIPEEQYFDFLKKGGIDDSSIILQRIDSSNATHLHFAAAYNFCQVARYLLSLGILVDVLDNKHWTSLHVACHFSQQAMIQVLLENQADPTILTDKGHTAYELCSNHEMQEWMANFVTMLSQSDPLKRRATLPPSYTNVSNDFSFKRNSLRRSSLREHRNFKRHNDNYRFVLIAKDTLCNSMTDNNFEQKAKIDESLNHENSNNQNSKLDETANKIDIELDYNIKDDNIMDKAGFAANYNQSLIDNHSSIEMMSSQSEYKRTISNEKRNGKWFGCCSIF